MRHSDYTEFLCRFKEKIDSSGEKKKSFYLKVERKVLFCEGFGGFTADARGPGLAEWLLVAPVPLLHLVGCFHPCTRAIPDCTAATCR